MKSRFLWEDADLDKNPWCKCYTLVKCLPLLQNGGFAYSLLMRSTLCTMRWVYLSKDNRSTQKASLWSTHWAEWMSCIQMTSETETITPTGTAALFFNWFPFRVSIWPYFKYKMNACHKKPKYTFTLWRTEDALSRGNKIRFVFAFTAKASTWL